jgi:Tol biopolymer transport system component
VALTAGARLGPYEITAQIGAGGMGEVYRATDKDLKRQVAIKVLPEAVAADAERLVRFQREAEVLASLNHPNIAIIHGLEKSDGVTGLVMELVEGPTLADRIGQGPVPIDEALPIAKQIAEALEAAHEQGIIHRDLKPANIKVRTDGTVKVLDFGLAKAMEPAGVISPNVSQAATITTPAMTQAGMILGTTAYMSPEQARGKPVDKRTDIWAFGCVLYEMLTGRAVFTRSTTSDTVAAILGSEPEWERLPARTPPTIQRLLQRCLEKDTKRRLRDIGDAGIEIDDALVVPTAADAQNHTPSVTAAGARWWRAVAALAVIASTAGAVAVWKATPATDQLVNATVSAFAIHLQPGQQLPIDTGLPVVLAISPDGQQVAYAARDVDGDRLYLRRRNELEASPIPGTEGAIGPFFSPDGQSIGFGAGGFLRAVPLAGGPTRTLGAAANLQGASWGSDGVIVYSPQWSGGLFRVSATGGTAEPLTATDEFHKSPHVLPGGKAVLTSVDRDRVSVIEVVEIATGNRRPLIEGQNPVYMRTGHLVFARGSSLFAVPFDLTQLAVTGETVQLMDGVRVDGNDTHFAVANDGTLVYVPETATQSRLVWFDRKGQSRPLDAQPRRYAHPRISPDGTRVVVTVARESGGNEIWIYDVERGAHAQLSATGRVSRPIWTADSKGLTFQRDGDLYSAPADDSAGPQLLLKRDAPELVLRREDRLTSIFPLDWSSDGSVLVFSAPAPTTNRDVWTLRGEMPCHF